MPTLQDLAAQFRIDAQKPFFPVNSLRLLYFLICDYYSSLPAQSTSDAAATSNQQDPADPGDPSVLRNKISAVLPLIDQVLEHRTEHHTSNPLSTPQDDLSASQESLQKLFEFIDTPNTHHIFSQLFTYTYPLQDNLLTLMHQEIMSAKKLAVNHLDTLLKIRAMDSIVFSTVLSEMLPNLATDTDHEALHYHINLMYQLNDLVDAIVFAKDDMDAKNFSPFQIIIKIAPEPLQAKELIKDKLNEFQIKSRLFPFPAQLNANVQIFYAALLQVVQGN